MSIKVIVKNGESFERTAADFVEPGVIALPTGNTPLDLYQELRNRSIDWSKLSIFMLDVNYPQDPADPTSFYNFVKTNLPGVQFNILDSAAKDPAKECAAYEAKIKAAGGLDLVILGIGVNGHIAYNEPGTSPESLTHVANLDPGTVSTNHLKIKNGLTMGIKTILSAKKILLLAKGSGKADAVKAALTPPPNLSSPASWLQNHSDCTFLIDDGAAGKL
jgi:glucosamine-6-phosphate deaminase